MATPEAENAGASGKSADNIKPTLVPEDESAISSIVIPINNLWELNHWGSDVATVKNGRMIFRGTKTRLESDGCSISLKDVLNVGHFIKVWC